MLKRRTQEARITILYQIISFVEIKLNRLAKISTKEII
jgi:hypothetical protein